MENKRDIFVPHMKMLQDINRTPPSGEALVRIYKHQLSLNAAAKALLKLEDDSKVSFRKSDDRVNGKPVVYISKKPYSAYSLLKVDNTYRISSTSLCRSLADLLQGYGTYRIEGESPVKDYNGDICYSIFFRKYE